MTRVELGNWTDGNAATKFLVANRDTPFARRHGNNPDTFDSVLKLLMMQKDPVARRRFHIEVESLRTLDLVGGVAKLLATNAERFAETDVELYIVSERVHGHDLTKYANDPTDVATACAILFGLLSTIGECHGLGIAHRDLKPCHVILRDENISDPVIIDFGLAFNDELLIDNELTASDRGVGNRFIILPEQLDGRGKKDKRSDITQCVGLLYFLLTGDRPGLIAGEKLRKPHEQNDLKLKCQTSQFQLRQLQRIFDIGFEWDIERRWQSTEDLVREISSLANETEKKSIVNFRFKLNAIIDGAKTNPEIENQQAATTFFRSFLKLFEEKHAAVAGEARSILTIEKGSDAITPVKFSANATIRTSAYESQPALLIIAIKRNADALSFESTQQPQVTR